MEDTDPSWLRCGDGRCAVFYFFPLGRSVQLLDKNAPGNSGGKRRGAVSRWSTRPVGEEVGQWRGMVGGEVAEINGRGRRDGADEVQYRNDTQQLFPCSTVQLTATVWALLGTGHWALGNAGRRSKSSAGPLAPRPSSIRDGRLVPANDSAVRDHAPISWIALVCRPVFCIANRIRTWSALMALIF